MQNSTYNPENKYQFTKSKLKVNHFGKLETCAAGNSVNIDYLMSDDHLLVGLQISAKGHVFGDKLRLSVLAPGDIEVDVFAQDWFCHDDAQLLIDEEAVYPAKIPAGFKIRVNFTSTGSDPVQIIVNYKLHKVLV